LKNIFYTLKKHFGQNCALYRVTNKAIDRITGVTTLTKTKIPLSRAVITTVNFHINPQYQSNVKIGDREVLIEYHDLTDFEPSMNDYFVIEGDLYNTVNYMVAENNGWYYQIRKMQKQEVQQIFNMTLVEFLSMEVTTSE
jgi:hypothetical protein